MWSFKLRLWMFLSIIALQISLSHSHSHEGHSHEGHSHEPPSFKYSKEANTPKVDTKFDTKIEDEHLWFNALSSTFVISILPFVILYFIPVDGSPEKKPFLKILLAFASGSLLGDAFLHLIPHALMASGSDAGHSHSHSHGDGEHHGHDNSVGLGVLGGIIMFLIVEKSIRLFDGGHSHSHNTKKQKDKKEAKNDIKIAGYLNLAADFTHNFTDGLAIGASYIAGLNIGIITTVTIFLHEIPHEIGDFAILVQSGCSRRKAMLFQLLTALGAFLGTFVSLYVKSAADGIVSSLILPFTAGGFIYIATVSVIPDLLEGGNVKLSQSVKEIMALLAGVCMMVLIAKYE